MRKKKVLFNLYLFLGLVLVLVPAGLLTRNPAWGEWEADYYRKALGFIPENIRHFSAWYSAPIAGYHLKGHGDILGYYLSAVFGVALIFIIFFLMRRFAGRKRK